MAANANEMNNALPGTPEANAQDILSQPLTPTPPSEEATVIPAAKRARPTTLEEARAALLDTKWFPNSYYFKTLFCAAPAFIKSTPTERGWVYVDFDCFFINDAQNHFRKEFCIPLSDLMWMLKCMSKKTWNDMKLPDMKDCADCVSKLKGTPLKNENGTYFKKMSVGLTEEIKSLPFVEERTNKFSFRAAGMGGRVFYIALFHYN